MPNRRKQDLGTLVILRRVRDRIDRDYAAPLDVESLARDAGMSAGHLSRQFKIAFGESPYSYLMTRRIERAMALLRLGEMSVTEVCFAVGCGSLGTFSTRFTELVGIPPSRYKANGAEYRPGMLPCIAKHITRPARSHRSDPTASDPTASDPNSAELAAPGPDVTGADVTGADGTGPAVTGPGASGHRNSDRDCRLG